MVAPALGVVEAANVAVEVVVVTLHTSPVCVPAGDTTHTGGLANVCPKVTFPAPILGGAEPTSMMKA
jgi:hypothetical protein